MVYDNMIVIHDKVYERCGSEKIRSVVCGDNPVPIVMGVE